MSVINTLGDLKPSLGDQLSTFRDELKTPAKLLGAKALDLLSNSIKRAPWIMTCDEWVQGAQNPSYIIMDPNPSDITLTIPLRSSMEKTAGGSVTYVWRDPSRSDTIFDEPIVELTMQSGSLLPVMTEKGFYKEQGIAAASRITPNFPGKDRVVSRIRKGATRGDYTVPKGVEVYYKFIKLFNVNRIKKNTSGEPNYIRLVINTLMFPHLTLRGQFVPDESLTYTQNSEDNPSSIKWTVRLVINKITPDIGMENLQSLLDEWRSSGGSSGFITPPIGIEEIYKSELQDEIKTESSRIKAQQQTTETNLEQRKESLNTKYKQDETAKKVKLDNEAKEKALEDAEKLKKKQAEEKSTLAGKINTNKKKSNVEKAVEVQAEQEVPKAYAKSKVGNKYKNTAYTIL